MSTTFIHYDTDCKDTHRPPVHKCERCGMSTSNLSSYRHHLASHIYRDSLIFECDKCKRKYKSKAGIRKHVCRRIKM